MRRPRWFLSFILLVSSAGRSAAEGPSLDAQILEKENILDSAKLHAAWLPAAPIQPLSLYEQVRTGKLSRGLIRLLDTTTARMDQNSQLAILPVSVSGRKATIDLHKGQIYVKDREPIGDLEIRTPGGIATPHGTEFQVSADEGGNTVVTPLEGEVVLANARGSVSVSPGDQGFAKPGQAPYKTAAIYAKNDIIQWVLYYPAVLDPADLGLAPSAPAPLAASVADYAAGDLLGALRAWPANYLPRNAGERLYRAAVLLAVGRADEARRAVQGVPEAAPGRMALEEMMAAVQFRKFEAARPPTTAGEWMARSYYRQSLGDLDGALADAQAAAQHAPGFGYALERVAELEFSFGRIEKALPILDRAIALSPRNAQALALRGFLLSAENRIGSARDAFDAAISLDGALGNAWLGRGLTWIRQGRAEAGQRDLQAAAGLEPNRSLLHSYLGKAFSQEGAGPNARSEFQRAEQLDPKDPTPWLYSAIEAKQENRYNDAVRDLEKSIGLNDNRRIYRSQFLLDQDQAVRGANLAAIYLNDGMIEQSVREAVKAVDEDYSSASAHLFLSNSYDALRDPNRVELRYETAWFNELLLSNLLSPVGGGPLSQFVSQQEYSKLFAKDGLGISSSTDYFSNGELHETASQYGTSGNLSYAIDTEYLYERGYRPNDSDSLLESYATFKLQLGPADTVLFKASYEDQRTGNIVNSYDPRAAAVTTAERTEQFHELQEPGLLLLGLHHEWAPGIQTLILLGRLANEQTLTAQDTAQNVVTRNIASLVPPASGNPTVSALPYSERAAALQPFAGRGQVTAVNTAPFDFDYYPKFEIYNAEIQQIVEAGPMTFIGGVRYQKGRFDTSDQLTGIGPVLNGPSGPLFNTPAAADADTVSFQRINLYAYDIWRVAPWLSVTGGVTWDDLTYPDNFRSPPVNGRGSNLNKVSPKAGFILQPTRSTTLRGAFAEAISGASFDESVRLEPTEVAGFTQAYRTIIPEDVIGSIAGATYKIYGLSLEQKLPIGTYLGIGYDILEEDLGRDDGDFDSIQNPDTYVEAAIPSSLRENIAYRERILTATANQLIGMDWSLGARFQYTRSTLLDQFPGISTAIFPGDDTREKSGLYETSLFALYNHPSGFFARFEADWYKQVNRGYAAVPGDDPQVGADFWQLNIFGGYRFYRNQCELSLGVLNLAGRDYRLEPLNPYFELPRERTLVVHCKFDF